MIESGDGDSLESYVSHRNGSGIARNRQNIPERDNNTSDIMISSNYNEPRSLLRPRLPRPRRPTNRNPMKPIGGGLMTTQAETHVITMSPSANSDTSEVSEPFSLPAEMAQQDITKSRIKHDYNDGDKIEVLGLEELGSRTKKSLLKSRIPTDTPPRRPTSSEDDTLLSVESKDKEKSPIDEYLTITMPSTPSDLHQEVKVTEQVVLEKNMRGSNSKSSFIKKWSKKMAESFKSSSIETNDADVEGLVQHETEDACAQVDTPVIQNEIQELRKLRKIRKKKVSKSNQDVIAPKSLEIQNPQISSSGRLLSPLSKRDLRRHEKTGIFKSTEKLLGIKFHHTDNLPRHSSIVHPVVRFTVMDQEGSYWTRTDQSEKKRKKNRRRQEEFEEKEEKLTSNSVQQFMTNPGHVRRTGISYFSAKWEEMLVISEPMERFYIEDANAIFFFEIMDFLPMGHESLRRAKNAWNDDLGWFKIAWGFLKPIGVDGTKYLNRKLRLQLYKPETKGSIYKWWKKRKWVKLNSTLYVTIKGILPPELETPQSSVTALLNMRKEELTEAIIDSQIAQDKKSRSKEAQGKTGGKLRKIPEWSRLPGQSCKVPNTLLLSLPASSIDWLNIKVVGNVFCVKFSPCGCLLAAGLDAEEYHVTLIFEIPSGKLLKSLRGHHGLIYELDWRILAQEQNRIPSSYFLASASADSTVMIWELGQSDKEIKADLRSVLLHPSFVYSLEFSPTIGSRIVTGCFDFVIRIWEISNFPPTNSQSVGRSAPAPLYLLDGHNSHINSVRFHPSGELLFSGDASGILRKWTIQNGTQPPKFEKEVNFSRNSQMAISSLCVDATGRKLLVHLRKSCLKILDVETFLVLNTFQGLVNEKLRIQSVFSPCGNLVLSGSEDSAICVWDADTSRLMSRLQPKNHSNCVVSTVSYHPFDHYVAIGLSSSANEAHPILFYNHTYPKNTVSLGTVANLKKAFGGSRSTTDSTELDRPFRPPSRPNRVDSSEKFRNIIQKLDEVTGGVPPIVLPQMAQVAVQLINAKTVSDSRVLIG